MLRKLRALLVLTIQSLRHDGLRITIVKVLGVVRNFLLTSAPPPPPPAENTRSARNSGLVFSAPRVTIIADMELSQCVKYRVSQKVEILRALGLTVYVSDQNDFFRARKFLQVSTSVIFYRATLDSKYVPLLLAEAVRCGVKVAYDIDDPIFCERTYRTNTNLEILDRKEQRSLLASADGFLSLIRCSDFCLGSTPAIVNLMSELSGRQAFLWRNLIDYDALRSADGLVDSSTHGGKEALTIFYGSGSRAHDYDFRVVAGPLRQFLEEHPETRLKICGYLGAYELKGIDPKQISFSPFSDYRAYLANLATTDVSLVPLERSEFNHCKSVVRYLDASVVGTETLASGVGDYANLTEHSVGLTSCNSDADWFEALKIISQRSDSERAVIRKKIRINSLENFSVDSVVRQSLEHIDSRAFNLLSGGQL